MDISMQFLDRAVISKYLEYLQYLQILDDLRIPEDLQIIPLFSIFIAVPLSLLAFISSIINIELIVVDWDVLVLGILLCNFYVQSIRISRAMLEIIWDFGMAPT